jgi:aspartate ammonia-lyase
MEKVVSDLRLLASGLNAPPEIRLPERQVGSSIMPGKVNPVIPEYVITSAHRIYANDQLITSLAGQGCLELNAYLPEIGYAVLESLKLMVAMNRATRDHLLNHLEIDEEAARARLFQSPAITTALSPLIGYHNAGKLAKEMKKGGTDIFAANRSLDMVPEDKLKAMMQPENLLRKGFTMKDIREHL